MNTNRTIHSIKNIFSGFTNKIINILMPFIVRTVIIYQLGLEYAGLSNLFSSILQVLNLAELGISAAVVYCMYKPMADNDTELLCALYRYMRKLYYIIGFIVAIVGIGLIPFMSCFINGTVPDGLNVYILYIIYLLYTVVGYFFYAYKSTLLNAGQKIGVLSNINSGIVFLQSIVQIIILVVWKNYYLFLGVMPLCAVINNYWISYVVKKEYPHISCRNELSNEIKKDIAKRVKGLFVTRICTTTRNAFDSIFISAFLGLSIVGIYGNYYYIMTAIVSLMSVITTAMTASVGNSLATESIEKNYHDMITFNFIYNWIVGIATCCMMATYQTFIRLWVGERGMLPFNVVVVICIYFYFLCIGSIRAVYHDAAGLWWEARYRAIIEAILNLVLNYILTKTFGVFGTILGTLISLVLVNYIYGTQIVFKYYFKNISSKKYFFDNLMYFGVAALGCILTYFVINLFDVKNVVLDILVKLCCCVVVFNLIYYLFFCKSLNFRNSKLVINHILFRNNKVKK